MSQNDYTIANQSAPDFRSDLNEALQALASLSSGSTAPSTTYANMLWYDDANNILKMRSEADDAWINLGELDQINNLFRPANAIPTGAINSFATSSAPEGWLKCDGLAVSRTTYPSLFSTIGTIFGSGDGSTTFNVPDLRGEFVRGWDDGRGVDSGRAFGSSQLDAFQGHHHANNAAKRDGGFFEGGVFQVSQVNPASVTDPISDGTNGTPRTAAETRPRNIALLYCIKT